MAADFEVTGRLAEGAATLDTTQTYVSAAAARGYRHPDLTQHSRQVWDWYGTEEGLDLRALDADCVAMRAAAQSLSEALRCVRTALPAVTSTWGGEGGGAAIDFLVRHGDRAQQVAAAVEAAARSCERLRDELWRTVDGKVEAMLALGTGALRPEWLAAARTVLAGGSDQAAAVVDSEITPFVATAVSGDWVTAMRATVNAVTASYRAAVDEVGSRPVVRFDIPGDLGPPGGPRVASAPIAVPASAPAASAPAVPVAAEPESYSAPAAFDPGAAAAPTVPAAAPVVAPPPAPLAAPAPLPGATPAALGEPASALSGLPGQFADALGGLFGGASPGSGGLPELPGLSEPAAVEPVDMPDLDSDVEPDREPEKDVVPEEESTDEEAVDADEVEIGEPDEAGGAPEPEPPAEALEPDCPPGEEPQLPAPDAPVGAPEPITSEPAAPVPAPAPAADPSATPCEIAADELPQVGQ